MSTTSEQPPTITEFLLARIAEEEADEFLYAHTSACASNHHPYPDSWDPGECNCGADDRRAAECEAKRRIVEAYRLYDERAEEDSADREAADIAVGLQQAVVILAAVYGDHPDYATFGEDWRP